MVITGDQIKTAREAIPENQEAFAKRFGLHRTTILRWERDGIPITGTAQIAAQYVLSQINEMLKNEQ